MVSIDLLTEKKIERFINDHPKGLADEKLFKQLYGVSYNPEQNRPEMQMIEMILSHYPTEFGDSFRDWMGKYENSQKEMLKNVGMAVSKKQKKPIADDTSSQVTSLENYEEKDVEWLFSGLIPVGDISILAGDGGVGKTLIWCNMAAAVTNGTKLFFEEVPEEFANNREPRNVLFFSSEDSIEYTLKKRLREAGAVMSRVLCIDLKDDRFSEIKFDSELLKKIIDRYRPALVIFDPLQSFLPAQLQMGSRNAMRNALNPLIGLGERYRISFLIIVHTNKRQGVYGRNRVADSADIWDIARSVLILGKCEDDHRYISQEKSNYGPTSETAIFDIDGEGRVKLIGFTQKKDADFVSERDSQIRQAPQREDAKAFILEYLKNGERLTAELDEAARTSGISGSTLNRAKTELKKEGLLGTRSEGFYPKKYYSFLITRDKQEREKEMM